MLKDRSLTIERVLKVDVSALYKHRNSDSFNMDLLYCKVQYIG